MTFKEAKKECRRAGTSRAQGDALRAMYAELIVATHPGNQPALSGEVLRPFAGVRDGGGDSGSLTGTSAGWTGGSGCAVGVKGED